METTPLHRCCIGKMVKRLGAGIPMFPYLFRVSSSGAERLGRQTHLVMSGMLNYSTCEPSSPFDGFFSIIPI